LRSRFSLSRRSPATLAIVCWFLLDMRSFRR
jgi:hypothetical protein